MAMILEIEYLTGVSVAALGPDSPIPDWPPQPDRIFSALVATWAAHGQDPHEAAALEWLEALPPPRILASAAAQRSTVTVYVPPNDPRSDRQKTARGVLPALRLRQPRTFPAARPEVPRVCLLWPEAHASGALAAALERLAADTAYIGHSPSLTRCRFLWDEDGAGLEQARQPERRVYAGRFAELRQCFDSGRRPLPGARLAPPPPPAAAAAAGVFADRWLVLEHVDGTMPDVRACALVAKAIRDTLFSGYRRCGQGNAIPEVVSGHKADGSPSRAPHLAVIPLADAGHPHADGHVMGFALVPPRGSTILEDATFRAVLRLLAPHGESRRVMTVQSRGGTPPDRAFAIALAPTLEPQHWGLDPRRYTEPAQVFATLTPVVLDRHLKAAAADRQQEMAAQIAAACRNAGLPEPEDIIPDKHSALTGMPSAQPSGPAPDWLHWRLPRSLASRQLTHAVIRFAEPVAGPVIIGAGRFVGLGLCRPLWQGDR